MNNRWLGFLIPKIKIVVPSMNDVAYLRRKKVVVYGLKPHPDGYEVTIRKGAQKYLEEGYDVKQELSIYPALSKFALPVLAVFFMMMALMNRYSIGFEITGNLNPEQVRELEELVAPHFRMIGPFEFLLTDIEQIEADLADYYDEYIWFDVFRDGNNINIHVFHTNNNPSAQEISYSSALYARRTGLIKKVDLKIGRSLVTPGDMVRQGDRLITNTVLDPTGSDAEISTNKAVQGEVWAETWYLAEIIFPLQYFQNMFTTRLATRRILTLGGLSWQFPAEDVEFIDYETSVRRLDPFFFLENSPLFLETIHYYEKSDIMKVNDIEEIKQHAASLIKNEFASQTGEEFELVNWSILESSEMDNQVTLLFHVTILENIAH